MKLFNKIVGVLAVVFLLFNSVDSSAQCKRFTKKNCLPSLKPYLHNGQLTSTYMMPGDTAEVLMSFNAGKEYRVIVCSQELIGKVQFKVLDKQRKILYKSDRNAVNPSWDFKVTNTQQFIIQITVPQQAKTSHKVDMMINGCVSLLIGFKE